MRVSYPQMVKNLFRVDGLGTALGANALMHAAVGVMGEAVEFRNGHDITNKKEELGDILFYVQAGVQSLGSLFDNDVFASEVEYTVASWHGAPIYELEDMLVARSADLLDLAKKVWAYGQEITTHAPALTKLIGSLTGIVKLWCVAMDIDEEEVLILNQDKLAKRYPEGVYSSDHAEQRLDKQGE